LTLSGVCSCCSTHGEEKQKEVNEKRRVWGRREWKWKQRSPAI